MTDVRVRFVLIPGAGGAGWYWHRVVPLLEQAGHEVVALDLPADDPHAGQPEYVELVLAACEGAGQVVLVGQSMGAFPAVMAADRLVSSGRPPAELVLLNAMIPAPGETAGAWWEAVGQEAARTEAARAGGWPEEFDLETYFLHDVDPAVAAEGEQYQRDEAEIGFTSPCDVAAWPEVPTRVVTGADDRFFPLALQQRLARERLGVEPTVVPGGHLAALSYPEELATVLLARG